jgi:hypothetical protein
MHLFALSASIDFSIFDGLYTIAKVYEKGSYLGTRSPEKEYRRKLLIVLLTISCCKHVIIKWNKITLLYFLNLECIFIMIMCD